MYRRLLYLFITLFCLSAFVSGQDLQALPVHSFFGKKVGVFKDSLVCKDAARLDQTFDQAPDCMSFMISPSSSGYSYGDVHFESVVLFPDSLQVVRSLAHFMSFKKGGKEPGAREVREQLIKWLSRWSGFKPKITRRDLSNSTDLDFDWEREGFRVNLKHSGFLKREKGKLVSILQLFITEK